VLGAVSSVAFLLGSVRAAEGVSLTGNPEKGSDMKRARLEAGRVRIVLPGLDKDGYPAKATPRVEGWQTFAQSLLCDGDLDTAIEWSEEEFGREGRDLLVDLGAPCFLERIEVDARGRRLHSGTLYLKPDGGARFVPVREFDKDDYVDVENDWRNRTALIRFDKLGVTARYIRINVKGSHTPRFAELRIRGRIAGPGDSVVITPMLAYAKAALKAPALVEQVPPPDPQKAFPSGEGPRFEFRGVRLVPPNKQNQEFYRRLVRALAELKFNRIVHEGLDWAVKLASWKTDYGKAISVEDLKEVLKFHESLGLKTSGGWAIAPATWVMQPGDPTRVEARPGEAYAEKGRIQFKQYKGEALYRLSRVNVCPLHPKNFETFQAVVDEICSIYTDEYFFGGVDEPLQWYNGARWGCCERCKGQNPVQLMADWVNKCSDHIRNRHKRIHMYQTTILLKEHQGEESGYPGGPKIPMYEILDRMPKDRVALVNWSYGSWQGAKNEPDSSNLNRFLAAKGYKQIIQNVGYGNASFAICEFTKWAGKDGADFIGATVANYGKWDLDGMAREFKFLDYVVNGQALWNPDGLGAGSRDAAAQIVNGVEKVREILEDRKSPARRAKAEDFFTVDIKASANRSAKDEEPFDGRGWVDQGPGLDLRALPRGKQTLCGIPFELLGADSDRDGSCVMLEGPGRLDPSLPSEVKGIRVGRRAASLVFLHALTGQMEPTVTAPAFLYRVRYEDGTQVDFPVRYRIEVMEWLDQSARGPNDLCTSWFLYGARPAWLGTTACGARAILYAAEWINPHPEREIQSLDMIVPGASLAPGVALFAISGVSSD
jgi:hypothetical protein